jgi:hypothetical protein
MTPQEAAEILKTYNIWRRWNGDPDDDRRRGNRPEMPHPKQLGQAIDVIVAYVESQS